MVQVGKRSSHTVNRTFAMLEVRLLEALILRDMAALEHRLGEEFTLTTGRPGAEVRSRAEWLRVAQDEYAIESFKIDEIRVQPYEGVTVVRVRYRQIGRLGEADRSGVYRMTDVFAWRDEDWRLVARHATQVTVLG